MSSELLVDQISWYDTERCGIRMVIVLFQKYYVFI